MNIVIAGALGHIGSQVVRDFSRMFPSAQITMVDNMMTQRYCSLFNLPKAATFHFLEADVLKVDLDTIFAGADVVMQFAAITDAANSFHNQEAVEYNNFNTTARIADVCAKTKTPMLHMSSTSVYGTQSDVVDESCAENDLQPQSPYAETKLKEEKYLQALSEESNLRFVICRCGTIAGTSPGMRFHTAVNKFCWQAVMGVPLTVWRTALHQKRPYLSLDDAVRAFQFIIKNELFDGQIYNVLTENLTVFDIIESIKKHVPDIDIRYVDTKIMNQLSYDVSNSKFTELGFEFVGSIQQSISDTIALLRHAASAR
ncbi:NAD-dependent epimerase/dehydratase family protein [Planctomycetota bacterium]